MGYFYDHIPDNLIPWILAQHMFWVATAPLTETGHVNVSPKGFKNTFHIENPKRVWYEDLSGSGIETISHIRENGRITLQFTAFEGRARIIRIFGRGTVHEFGTPEYDRYLPKETRQPGSRAAIIIDLIKLGTSCGYSIPSYDYKYQRLLLHNQFQGKENKDVEAELSCTPEDTLPPRPHKGLKAYWGRVNLKSLDGLPGLTTANLSMNQFAKRSAAEYNEAEGAVDDQDEKKSKAQTVLVDSKRNEPRQQLAFVDRQMLLGFVMGVLLTMLCVGFRNVVHLRAFMQYV